MEAHLVFYNEEYESLEDALPYPNAVTVIGILFQVWFHYLFYNLREWLVKYGFKQETDSENVTSHDNFEVIDKAVELVYRKAGNTVTASGAITISDFFPTNIETYFQYTGSLTTPDCNEDVNWIVITNPSTIYKEDVSVFFFSKTIDIATVPEFQLDNLAIIYTEESERLKYNNRDLQETNNRTVYIHTA